MRPAPYPPETAAAGRTARGATRVALSYLVMPHPLMPHPHPCPALRHAAIHARSPTPSCQDLILASPVVESPFRLRQRGWTMSPRSREEMQSTAELPPGDAKIKSWHDGVGR